MDRLRWLMIVAGVLAAAAPAPADSPKEPPRAGSDFTARPVRKTGMRFRENIEAWVKSLKLPKDQEKQLLEQVQRQKAQQEAMEKAREAQVKELQKQTDALRNREQELRKQMEALQAEQAKCPQPQQGIDPKGLLTAEQVRAWESHKLSRALFHEYRQARLTQEQQDKLRSLCDGEAGKLAAAAPAEREEILRKVREGLAGRVDKLLTDDQRSAMETQRLHDDAAASMRGVHLTNEQYEQIGALCGQAVKQWHRQSGTNEAAAREWNEFRQKRQGFLNDLVQDIRRKVLTKEQREQLDAPRPRDQGKAQ